MRMVSRPIHSPQFPIIPSTAVMAAQFILATILKLTSLASPAALLPLIQTQLEILPYANFGIYYISFFDTAFCDAEVTLALGQEFCLRTWGFWQDITA